VTISCPQNVLLSSPAISSIFYKGPRRHGVRIIRLPYYGLGILNQNLSLVDTNHVVGTVHLYIYLPLVPLPPTAGKCGTSQRNYCLFTDQLQTCCCVPTAGLYLTSIHAFCVCVCACVNDYNHSVHRFAKHASRGKAITRTSQTSGMCTASTKVPHKLAVGTARQVFTWLLVQCSIMLVHSSNTQAVGTA
jgi:hypothetical protein